MQYRKSLFINLSLICICLSLFSKTLFGQAYGPLEDRFSTIRQNSSSTLEASNQRVWIGPGLNSFDEDAGEIFVPTNADSVFDGRGRVFSLEVNQNRILAGLGFTSTRGGSSVNAAQGYYLSNNTGNDWTFISFPLDERADETCDAGSIGPPCDIEFQYGNETYVRTRITVPEQSPPFEVEFRNQTLFSVNWASGLLRSRDNGQTWQRLILPPFNVTELNPSQSYQWFSQTTDGETINRYDPRFDNNLLGFGLLIDKYDQVWAGTAGGINLSQNALDAPADQIKWKHISWNPNQSNGLLSNWVVTIREQPGTDRIWMTNWITDPENRDQNGIVYTDDNGETFHQFLEGIRANDIGFFEEIIYVAADDGLYISKDDGVSWNRMNRISGPNSFINADARYFAVTATDENLWVGTSDGIARSPDGGESWHILRVDVPLRGGNQYQPDTPSVSTYAYPNPYSPTQHSIVRIKFEIEQPGPATLRIFDFGMNPVYKTELTEITVSGSYETTWNGQTETGRIAANGTYFYSIDTPGGLVNGKILLLD